MLVGAVEEPPYFTLLTTPATEPVTIAVRRVPVKTAGEFVTDKVGVA